MTTLEKILSKCNLIDLYIVHSRNDMFFANMTSDAMMNAYVSYLDDGRPRHAYIATTGDPLLFFKMSKKMFNESNLSSEELYDLKEGNNFALSVKSKPEHFQDYVLEQMLKGSVEGGIEHSGLYFHKYCEDNAFSHWETHVIIPKISTIEELKIFVELEDI